MAAWCSAATVAVSCFWLEGRRLKLEKVNIFTDGASWGNPGPAAIGIVIKDEHYRPLTLISRRIGRTTNNQAEYQAIIAALEVAVEAGIRQVTLHTDSELIVRQIKGNYRVRKPGLIPLYYRVKELQSRLESFTIEHIPDSLNREAHNLANKALRSP